MGALTAEKLVAIATTADIPLEAVRIDYSGRLMYGAECIGFDLDHMTAAMLLGAALFAVLDNDDAVALVNNTRVDSMGMGTIVYFPDWTCADPEKMPVVDE